MPKKTSPKKVFVAMSGGVDSSVAAALLKERGFNVIGVFFKPWQPRRGVEFCNWKEDRQEALAAATVLGIPFKTWDFSREYKEKVGKYMIDAYREGLTPNPDVMCNKEIKFGLFLKRALAEGADFIATGHYVRLRRTWGLQSRHLSWSLFKARDKNKDQSYFLWTLTQKELEYCLFPVGDFTKPKVREIAKKFGLPNHAKKDSQGVCFIGQLNMGDFLKYYIKPKPGKVKLVGTEEVLGEHDGVYFYTLGQRHGLSIANGHGPYYVAGKNMKKNLIYVSAVSEAPLQSAEARLGNLSWVKGKPMLPLKAKAKARYRTKETPMRISKKSGNFYFLSSHPIRALTPGQSVVFYRGQEMMGGGIILPR